MFVTIQIDLTNIGELMRANPNIVRKVNIQGKDHQFLDLVVSDKKQPDQYGYDLNVKVSLPKDTPDDVKRDLKWFVGKGKNRQPAVTVAGASSPAPSSSAPASLPHDDTLPF